MATHGTASEAAGRVVVMCLPLPNLSAFIHSLGLFLARLLTGGFAREKKKILFSLPSLIFADAISALHSPWAPHRQPPVSSVVHLTFLSIAVTVLRPLKVVLG